MTMLKGKCKRVMSILAFRKQKRLEDPIHYYFAFVFVKDRQIPHQVGNKYQVCYFIFLVKELNTRLTKQPCIHLLLNSFYRQGTVLGTVTLP